MNESVSVACDKCGTKFRVKPNAYKVMRALKCTKCGHMVPLVKPPETTPPEPIKSTPPPEPVTKTEPAAPVEAVPAPSPAPTPEATASADHENELNRLREEIGQLREKLKATEAELAESDARVTDLQELWHSKELEVREMSARLAKAEAEAQAAHAMRETFLTQAKNELAHYLVGERDAALSRFADLEKKLLSIRPKEK